METEAEKPLGETKPPDKRTRPDVAERLKRRKAFEYSSVVMKWATFCKSKVMREGIETIVMNMNKIAFEAYHVANLHILRCLENNIQLPSIDQNFFYRCCAGVVCPDLRPDVGDTELNTSLALLKAQRPDEPCYSPPQKYPLALLMCDLARQMKTNFENQIVMNFGKRLLSYVRLRYKLKRKAAWKFVEEAFCDDKEDKTADQIHLQTWLRVLPTEENIGKDTLFFLEQSYVILKFMEQLPENTKGKKTFAMLPLKRSFVPAHVTISNSGLQQVLQFIAKTNRVTFGDSGYGITREVFKQHKDELWRELFDIGRYETKNRRFGYEISTNGYAVSVKFEKPSYERKKYDKKKEDPIPTEEDYDLFIGIDPGVTYLCTALNSRNETTQLSTRSYRHKAQMKKQQQWQNNLRNKRHPEYGQLLKDIPSFKTASLTFYLERLHKVLRICDKLFEFSAQQPFRRWRFKAFIYSQKTLEEFAKAMTCGEKRVLVGFGDWSQHDGFIKKHPKAPVKKFRKALSRYATVQMIDEYRTSKSCSLCGRDCKSIRFPKKQEDGSFKLVRSHQVVRCTNNGCTMCWQRDQNSSINHLNLLMCIARGQERPLALQRPQKCAKAAKK